MNVDGAASSHLPSVPDGRHSPQDCVGNLRVYGLQAILTHMHHIKPGLV
jgi:hypothetical protein